MEEIKAKVGRTIRKVQEGAARGTHDTVIKIR